MRKVVVCLGLTVAAVWLATTPVSARDFTFDERVKAQEAIERVYYSHQIGATKPFEDAVSRAVLEERVRKYLKESVALERFWNSPVTEVMLRREAEREARKTRMPSRLNEIYAALGNDSFLIEECVARPALADRLTGNFFAFDQVLHARERAAADELRASLVSGAVDRAVDHPLRTVADLVRADGGSGDGVALSEDLDTSAPAQPARSKRTDLSSAEFERLRAQLVGGTRGIAAVVEEREGYVIRALLDQKGGELVVATYFVAKRSRDEWWLEIRGSLDERQIAAVAPESKLLPPPASCLGAEASQRGDTRFDSSRGSGAVRCIPNDTWDNGSLDDVPVARYGHTAVWTGNVMVVWGGYDNSTSFNSGGRYDPATDTWAPTSTVDAPSARYWHSAVWTGSLMVVWGGSGDSGFLADGGKYDPVTDSWSATSLIGAPAGRRFQGAVWTGSELVIWGGVGHHNPNEPASGYFVTGARYDPVMDTWTPMSTANAPSGRARFSAVWTGSEMLVWGGDFYDGTHHPFNTGGRYDPARDIWTPTSVAGSPAARYGHTAIWTGSAMVIWAGFGDSYQLLNTGARYDPATDTWVATSTALAPSGRVSHTAVWTGRTMVVWGGDFTSIAGGQYDPAADTWTATSTVAAPSARYEHSAIWTGSLMVVWGGYGNDMFNMGGRYDPAADSWTPTSTGGTPSARGSHAGVWTGSLMLVWGGNDSLGPLRSGGRYDPAIDAWTATSTIGAPDERSACPAVWTGDLMLVWGGEGRLGVLDTGGRYDPIADAWSPTSGVGAPSARAGHTAIWTGSSMVIWGGGDANAALNTGGRYDPVTDTWTPTSNTRAPSARAGHTAVWTGNLMVVWGGGNFFGTGGRYDPSTDTWSPTSTVRAPSGRNWHVAVWTGRLMIVWGGSTLDRSAIITGGRYDPATDSWAATPILAAPSGRTNPTAVWTGRTMVVWGGNWNNYTDWKYFGSGGVYDPDNDSWMATSTSGAPSARVYHTAVWTGDAMVVWGGNGGRYLANGGRYYSRGDAAPVANAGLDQSIECTNDGSAVATLDGSGSTDCDSTPGTNDDIVLFEWLRDFGQPDEALLGTGATLNVRLPLGVNDITLRVTDRAGATATDEVLVTVQDTIPPVVTAVANPNVLWPPNHQMIAVTMTVVATDACDPSPSISLVSVVSSEPDDVPGGGDGHTTDDILGAAIGTPDFQMLLRAERDAGGPGRAYTITYQASDGAGNSAVASAQVTVPHDMGHGDRSLDVAVKDTATRH